MGSQEWHKFPKQPASVGTRVGGLVGILWVSPTKKVEKHNRQMRPTLGADTKKKILYLLKPK